MSINFTCPTCNKKYAVADALAGKSVQCKACKGPMKVPNAVRPVAAASAAAPAKNYFEPFPEPSLPPLDAEPAYAPPTPADAPRASAGAPCPKCRRLTAPNAVICTNCGQNLRTGKAVKTVLASNKPPSALSPAALIKNPFVYITLGLIVAGVVAFLVPSLLAVFSTAIIVVGVIVAIVGNLIFGLAMWRAVFEDHGFLPFVGLFIPVVNFFVHLWMIISYWAYAKKALACTILGFGIMFLGLFVSRAGILAQNLGALTALSFSGGGPAAPTFPELPALSRLDDGIDFAPIRVGGSGPSSGMKIILYLPATRSHQPHSLPCVLIAPAGTSMLTGASLSSSDLDEHIEYVRSGYAVAAFELDGDLGKSEDLRAFAAAIKKFRDARYGLTNAHTAIEFLLERVPDVDPDRLYAAGHSSAGGFALNLAADDPRIKAVVAYAPSTDILKSQPAELFTTLARAVPDIKEFAREASPITHVADINCPVFLFHANDDTVVPTAQFQAFASALRAAGNNKIQITNAPGGGHYDSMINSGIPAGIKWLARLNDNTPPSPGTAIVRTPRPVRPAPVTVTPGSATPPPIAIESPHPTPGPAPAPASAAITPPAPATPAAPPVPAAPRVFVDPEQAIAHYTIPAPDGYKPLALPAMGLRRWSGPGRSSYAVTVRHTPTPAAPPPSDKTITAGNITFFQTRAVTTPTAIQADYAARDGDYYIIINTVADVGDRSAARALPDAIAKIRVADTPAK